MPRTSPAPRRPRRIWAAAAVLAVATLVLAACSGGTVNGSPVAHTSAAGSSSASASHPASSSSAAKKPTKPVHVMLKWSDGSQFGVGIPIIAFLSRVITNASAFANATTVTVNGQVVHGAWYFENSDNEPGYPLEAHYRLQNFWPAHAQVHLNLPVDGLSAGPGLAFNDSLTLSFSTGAANIGVVNDSGPQHTLTITSDGKPFGTFPVSLGASSTPTFSGTKVIMEKVPTVCMHDTDNTYYECGIKYDQRLTYSGEYLHSAPWNISNIDNGVDSSNGCTNLLPADAIKLYNFLEVGDVVEYPNANGPKMQLGEGYGDWNVPWVLWQTGGAVSTS